MLLRASPVCWYTSPIWYKHCIWSVHTDTDLTIEYRFLLDINYIWDIHSFPHLIKWLSSSKVSIYVSEKKEHVNSHSNFTETRNRFDDKWSVFCLYLPIFHRYITLRYRLIYQWHHQFFVCKKGFPYRLLQSSMSFLYPFLENPSSFECN